MLMCTVYVILQLCLWNMSLVVARVAYIHLACLAVRLSDRPPHARPHTPTLDNQTPFCIHLRLCFWVGHCTFGHMFCAGALPAGCRAFLLMASDGLWDVVQEGRAAGLVAKAAEEDAGKAP